MLGLEKIACLGPFRGFRRGSNRKNGGPVPPAGGRIPSLEETGEALSCAEEEPWIPLGREPMEELRDLASLRRLLDSFLGFPPRVLGFENAEVLRISDHSRQASKGTVFFAVPGFREDGGRFAEEAVENGACAVVASRPLKVPAPLFLVPDVRRAAAAVADVFFRGPSRRIPVVGVTGTNGKTTVTDLLSLCLEDDARQVGSLGTIHYRLGPAVPDEGQDEGMIEPVEKILRARNTTPGPIALQAFLREMVDRGVRAAVLEISSHALDQGRCDSVGFTGAVFTNLSQDHLDYHGTLEAYARAKARLFEGLKPGAFAVLPSDDPSGAFLFERLPGGVRLVTYGFGPPIRRDCLHVRGHLEDCDLGGIGLRLETPEGSASIRLPLIGAHNARNALASVAAALGLGVGTLRAADALSRARPVAGRLERVDGGRTGFPIFVDYAHTPDALHCILSTLAPMTPGRLRVVFGCGGDRDRLKRPAMGRIAARLADHVVITDDNPRGEDPEAIRRAVLEGIPAPTRARVECLGGRAGAIRHALSSAREGDVVVIAGKGHETGQIFGDRELPFSDRSEVEVWLCSN